MAYSDIIAGASNDFGVPVDILTAIVHVESGGNRYAIGSSGEKGLMQLMPGTATELGVVNPFDPLENIRAGAKYLSQQYKSTGNWRDALAKYNGGKYYKGSQAQGYADKVFAKVGDLGGAIPIATNDAAVTVDTAKSQEPPGYVAQKTDEVLSALGDWFGQAGSRIALGLLAILLIVLGLYKLVNS